VIEGGKPGTSALAQAAQRRAAADRLLVEAGAFETLAADERIMASQLATLPRAYVILHDVRVPDSPGIADHLVVGPGGAFLVLTRRYLDPIGFHDGELWSGSRPLRPELDSARVQSALLTRALATPFVPVIGLVGTAVPNSTPPVVNGVLVCSADYVARVLTRASHTMLGAAEVADAVNRALPLMTAQISVNRHDPTATQAAVVAHGTPSDSVPVLPSTVPTPGVLPSSPQLPPAAGRASAPVSAEPGVEAGDAAEGGIDRRAGASNGSEATSARGRFWRRTGTGAAVLAALAVVTFAVGGLVRVLWSGDVNGAQREPASSVVAGSTTLFVPPTEHPPLAAAVEPPTVRFVSRCPAKGEGWSLVPTWPGDLEGLASYVVEVRTPKGPWHRYSAFSNRLEMQNAAITGQEPGTALIARITAVMSDGSRSLTSPSVITAPAHPC
jgi:hypothetical protein